MGRIRVYASNAARQRAYRERLRASATPLDPNGAALTGVRPSPVPTRETVPDPTPAPVPDHAQTPPPLIAPTRCERCGDASLGFYRRYDDRWECARCGLISVGPAPT
jgi:hypothetical protein